ncbi:hypothetical protein [Sorangium sp. So ce542]|uniref:hypothetical protein n=1 Tax=Sorangium sp. So ce542 TaxID=3133316 RepID=UPI003F623AFD
MSTARAARPPPRPPPGGAQRADSFRCFVLDPGLTEPAWVQGYDVLPGDREVVHHALLFIDANRESEALGGERGSYPCFGDARLSETALLGAWAPGTQPLELPPDVGIAVPTNALLVMQVHYHPKPGKTSSPEAIRVAFRAAGGSRQRSTTQTTLVVVSSPCSVTSIWIFELASSVPVPKRAAKSSSYQVSVEIGSDTFHAISS